MLKTGTPCGLAKFQYTPSLNSHLHLPQKYLIVFSGIESKAGYFAEIGVGILWLSPIYESPMVDFGYDISNFTNIDPLFGTMDDFKSLSQTLKDNGKGRIITI